MGYLYLAIAIIAEVIGTTALKATDGFTRPLPSLVVVVSYAAAFYFLALVLRVMPGGIAYAIWAGVGTVLIAVAGIVVFRQMPDWPAIVGMALIVAGVIMINAFSGAVRH